MMEPLEKPGRDTGGHRPGEEQEGEGQTLGALLACETHRHQPAQRDLPGRRPGSEDRDRPPRVLAAWVAGEERVVAQAEAAIHAERRAPDHGVGAKGPRCLATR